jgi:RNA polymerase sigma factor (sigma-70 family)
MAIETLGAALRQIERLFAGGVNSGLPDHRLLDLFIQERDESAFEILVARHGPMVLSVCRGILRDPGDAEDAFQAVFLVLVKKAATIRGRQALGGWLYQVAHRVAVEANKAAARRRAREREGGLMASARTASGPTLIDELLSALHEEIARLPEKHRRAVVLCELEGMTHAQAAVELNWSERTLRRRLAEARDRLKARLGRRGLVDDAMLGAVFSREAHAAVPQGWNASVVRAAIDIVNPAVAAGSASAAAQLLTREVLKIMLFQKLKLATAALLGAGLMAWAASATFISRGDEPRKAAPAPVARRAMPTNAPMLAPEPDPPASVGMFPAAGRVLDPGVYVRPYAERPWSLNDPMAARQKGRVTSTDAVGRFHFELDKGASDGSSWTGVIGWHRAQIAVAAPGFAPAWVEAGDMVKRGEMALRLVRDDVPVRGRVLDPQGRPVAGVVVRIVRSGRLTTGSTSTPCWPRARWM